METLQNKLRQLRNWQGLTIADFTKRGGQDAKYFVNFENGDRNHMHPDKYAMADFIECYGLTENALTRLINDEWEWRLCARDGNPDVLPRIARYLYKPLPEVARAFFKLRDFVVLDLETSDKDPHSHRTEILEISALGPDGEILLNSLVKPEQSIPNTFLHGITDEMVADAPTFIEIYPQIRDIISGKVLVIYNANYDAYLLDNIIIRNGLDLPHFDQYCLMQSYAEYWKAPGKYGNYAWQALGKACEQQHVSLTEAHRALQDTSATYALLRALAEK